MIIQPRDIQILAFVGEHGLADTDIIHGRFFPEATHKRAVQKRLSMLVDEKLLEQKTFIESVELPTKVPPKKLPTIYRLPIAGVTAVERSGLPTPRRPARSDWPKPDKVLHRLGTIRTRLTIDDAFAVAKLPTPQWYYEQDIDPTLPATVQPDRRRILYNSFRHRSGQRVTCKPDAEGCFRSVRGRPWIAPLEYDRSTMKTADVAGKMHGYELLQDTKAYLKRWPNVGPHDFRILFICKSEQRIQELLGPIGATKAGQLVRFTTVKELTPEAALYGEIWLNVQGQRKRMLPPPI